MMSRSEKAEMLEQELKEEDKKEKNKKRKKGLIKTICILLVIMLCLLAYMHFIGTKGLQVREYKVESNMLPDSFHGFKIVHFSDLHYLSTVDKNDLLIFWGKKVEQLKTNYFF